jgi:hypothetical protein
MVGVGELAGVVSDTILSLVDFGDGVNIREKGL